MTSLNYLPASVVGLLTNTSPLWLSLGAAVVYRPRDSTRMLLGATLALVGVGLVLFREGADLSSILSGGGSSLIGVAITLLCSVVIAVQTVWARRVMRGRDPIVITSLACAWGALPLVAIAGAEGGVAVLAATDPPVKLLLLYLGVGCTAINFALFNHALQRVPAERAAAFQYLVPLLTGVMAFVFLKEAITWPLVVGGAAIIAGLVLARDTAARTAVRSPAGPSASRPDGARG